MVLTRIMMGMGVGACLLLGSGPAAEALPIAAPQAVAGVAATDGLVVQTVTRAGAVHRHNRRAVRRRVR